MKLKKLARTVTSALGVFFGCLLVVYAIFGAFSRISLVLLVVFSVLITVGLWSDREDGDA